jgi:5-methylcytosine-specific restriction endonuclease McrA
MKRVCLEPGCPLLTTATRCPAHARARQAARDAKRGTAAQRGYNREYQANRRALLAAGPHLCSWGCGRLATTADHVVPLSKGGGNQLDNLIPACSFCNSSRGSRSAPWRPRGGWR